ncbi:MAG: type VI secretion system accessory protein TagJ [Nitrospira sp.]
MKAKELLDANQLSAAILELNQAVKHHPTDIRIRTFLFELLCFDGAHERAARQLDVLGAQDEQAGIGVEVYRKLLQADGARRTWLSGGAGPAFMADPPEHVKERLTAMVSLSRGDVQQAIEAIARANSATPPISGTLNGQGFRTFADSDDRFGPVLELFVNGAYMWLPLEQIKTLVLPRPHFLRDLLWVPAQLECHDGQQGDVFLPALYSRSEIDENEQVRLGRLTEWIDLGEGLVGGRGLKTFLVDDVECSVLEIQELHINREGSE